jgi:hypothetical protein
MRRRLLGALALIIAAWLVIVLWFRKQVPPPRHEVRVQSAPPPAPFVPLSPPRARETRPEPAKLIAGAPTVPDPQPIIDEITVEKPEVCSGEENLVGVKAHTENGTDQYLHYVIDGQMGASYPVRLWRNDRGLVGEHTITVFGRGNTSITVPLPDYTVKDCRPERMVLVDRRLRPNTQSEFDFTARLVAPFDIHAGTARAAAPLKPLAVRSYTWSFGDGARETTDAPTTAHSYESRAQTSLYSYFVVGVELQAEHGQVLSGRTTLALINPAFEALAVKQTVALMISLTPRFPQLDSDGVVRQTVRLWHHDAAPLSIDRVLRTKYYRDGLGQSTAESIDPAGMLGSTKIPIGPSGVNVQVDLDTNVEPDVLAVTYRLDGMSEGGYPVSGSFSIMRPPPRPTRANSAPVTDAMLKAKILAARALLNKDVVSDEDIWQLEREGKLGGVPSVSEAERLSHGAPGGSGPPAPTQ